MKYKRKLNDFEKKLKEFSMKNPKLRRDYKNILLHKTDNDYYYNTTELAIIFVKLTFIYIISICFNKLHGIFVNKIFKR